MEELFKYKNLVYSIANLYRSYASMEDLYQAGFLGLMYAYKNFNSSYNTKFSTFAYPYILGEISSCVRKDRQLNVSRDIYSLNRKIESTRTMLTQELGRYPTDYEIMDFLSISYDEYVLANNSSMPVSSLDYKVDEDGDTMYEVIGRNMDLDTMILLKEELSKLSKEDREIILAHYIYDLTQMEIANKIGTNQVAVSRKTRRILNTLKQNIM